MKSPTTAQFAAALKNLQKPGGRAMDFIRAHYEAPGRAMTATRLADAAGYASYRAINLHYGKLAQRVAVALGKDIPGVQLELLVDGVGLHAVANSEWVLVMRPQFADALKRVGWV